MKAKFFIPLAGLALLCACKRSGYEVVSTGNNALGTDSLEKADTARGEKLVKTAGIQFKVKNVGQTEQKVSALTHNLGGLVTHQQINSTVTGSQDVRVSRDSVMRITSLSTSAQMTVKVPSVKLESFMDSVAAMGMYVTNRSLDISDRTLDYLSARLKLKSRSELIDRQKSGKVVIKDPSKVLDLYDDMVDQQIGNRQIDDEVKNSTVMLSFYQSNTINKEVIANDDPSAYSQPFFDRLLMACQNGWSLFIDLVIGLANIWFLILAGLLAWFYIIRHNRRKKAMA